MLFLEKKMATHSSILAWRIPETVGPCLWGRTESDMTEVTQQQQQQHIHRTGPSPQGQPLLAHTLTLTHTFLQTHTHPHTTVCVCVCVCVCVFSCSVIFSSLQPHEPSRLHCPQDSPGKNAGVNCHFLLQRIFGTQGSNSHLLHLLHWQEDSLSLRHLGMHTYIHTNANAYIYTHMCTHTYTPFDHHTHSHMYMFTYLLAPHTRCSTAKSCQTL